MKALKACLAVSFLAGMAMVPVGYAGQVTGNLASLSVTSPAYPGLETSLDLPQPGLVGDLTIFVVTDLSSAKGISGSFTEDYHAVNLTAPGGVSAATYYPNSVYNLSGGSSNDYDPATRTLTLYNAISSFGGTAPLCLGSISLCNATYESAPTLGSLVLTLVFDETFTNATGAAIFSHTLANGTVISGQYSFEGTPTIQAVPVPAAAWLLGSGLIGMAGVVRRRRLPN